MKKIDLGQTIGILANIGVIAGIVFLAIEVSQNNDQLNLQSYQTWMAANMELNTATLDLERAAIFTRGFEDSAQLTEDSWVAFAYWNNGIMQMAQAMNYLYRSGSLDESLWESEMQRAALILALPGVRQWWDAGARTQFTPEFVALIESIETAMTPYGWEDGRGFVPYAAPVSR